MTKYTFTVELESHRSDPFDESWIARARTKSGKELGVCMGDTLYRAAGIAVRLAVQELRNAG